MKPSHLQKRNIFKNQNDPHDNGEKHGRPGDIIIKAPFHSFQGLHHFRLVFLFNMVDKKTKDIEKTRKPCDHTYEMKGFKNEIGHVYPSF